MTQAPRKSSILREIFFARCPQCGQGRVTAGLFQMARRCPVCSYDLHPENGYYLGAMMLGFLGCALLTVPPMVLLKLLQVDDFFLVAYPFVQFLVLGPLLMYYAKVIWVHIAYYATKRMDR